jgi:outer membrane protein TolC
MKSKLQHSQIELAVLDAESNYKTACVNMNIMMGLPESTMLIPDKSGLALPTDVKSLEEYETFAFKNRNDVHAISIRKKVAELGVKNAQSDQYPSIALTGGYVAANIPKLLTVYNAINLGVGIKYNIASLWKNKPHVEQAVANVTQIEQGELALDDKIRMQLNQAYQSYVVSIKKIEVYETAVLQATENYRITKNKHDNSLTTTTELLDADVSLLQSKLSVTNAKADSFLAYINLLYTAGILTESN